jgi:hypothetical protein
MPCPLVSGRNTRPTLWAPTAPHIVIGLPELTAGQAQPTRSPLPVADGLLGSLVRGPAYQPAPPGI